MSTRHVLLGLLDIKPMSGYDVRRNLSISLDSLWAASYGQIYPALHKLAAEGLIRAEHEPQGKRERIVYHLTPAGRQELREWLEEPVSYLPYRDPFRFWASYLDILPDEVVLAGIDRHVELQRERLAYFAQVIKSIEAGEHPMIRARAEQLAPDALARLKATRAMIFRELAEQARFELESAERIRRFWQQGL
jgi:DNA-binding PadR family transcriptional regulator